MRRSFFFKKSSRRNAGSFAVSRVMVRYLLLEALSTFLILCCTIPLIASLAGPRYFLGSKSAGCSTKCLRISAVMARRRSVSMLTLQTPYLVAVRIISSGTPCAPGISPPNSLHFFTNSGKTVDAPWSTRGVSGIRSVDLLETFKVEVWLAFEFICAVAGPDSYSQGVNTGFFYEFRSFLRNGECSIPGSLH